jgi:hypothetical protein
LPTWNPRVLFYKVWANENLSFLSPAIYECIFRLYQNKTSWLFPSLVCNIPHVTTYMFIFRICPCWFNCHFTSWLSDVRHIILFRERHTITSKWQSSKYNNADPNQQYTIKTLACHRIRPPAAVQTKTDIHIYNSNNTGNVRITQIGGTSPNHRCPTKVIISKYYECVSVFFSFLCPITLSSVAWLVAVSYFYLVLRPITLSSVAWLLLSHIFILFCALLHCHLWPDWCCLIFLSCFAPYYTVINSLTGAVSYFYPVLRPIKLSSVDWLVLSHIFILFCALLHCHQ